MSKYPTTDEDAEGSTERLTLTIGLKEAAALLQMSEDALMRKTRAGVVPGAKIGRRWVYIRADLLELIRQKARETACRSTNTRAVPTGTSALAARLDALLARPRRGPRGRQ